MPTKANIQLKLAQTLSQFAQYSYKNATSEAENHCLQLQKGYDIIASKKSVKCKCKKQI